MALIYKPNVLYMSPKNEGVDITNGVDFSFMFKGYKLAAATGQLYVNNSSGEWSTVGSVFNFGIPNNTYYYNNDIITYHYPYGSNLSDNVNGLMGWGVTVYSPQSSQQAQANDVMYPSLNGFESGDRVRTYVGASPANYTFIKNYNFKLSLGSVNPSGTDAEGTDITNTFTVTQSNYLNLTSGDKIQAYTDSAPYFSNTAYYVYKVNEGATDPVAYYIKVFTTEEAAQSGSGTVVTSAVANKTFYVEPETDTTNIFYVGTFGGNAIKLYTTKEAALQGVSEAVVPLTENTTYTIQAFENSPVVPFTPLVVNTPVFSLDDIYGTNRGVTLTVTGDLSVYSYSTTNTLYKGQQLTCINVYNSVTTTYVYYINVYNGNTLSLYTNRSAAIGDNRNYITTLPANGTNTVYLSEILTTTKEFNVSWTDNNNVPLIVSWQASLYDVDVDDNNNVTKEVLIEQSDVKYTANTVYEFSHLLLSFLSNTTGEYDNSLGRYKVVFNLTDTNGYEYTASLVFDVGYQVVDTAYKPNVNVNNCTSAVEVDWHNAISVTGETTGTVDHAGALPYKGAKINKNSTITYNVDIPPESFPTFLFCPCSGFDGTIMTLNGETQSAVLSYDSSTHEFNFAVTNELSHATTTVIVDTDVDEISSAKLYLIGYADGKVYIREYGGAGYWH